MDFIKNHSQDTDIFCFQEIYDTKSNIKTCRGIRANLLSEIENILPNFQEFYFPTKSGFDDNAVPVDFDLTYGLAIFVKNDIKIISKKDFFIFKNDDTQPLKKDFSNLSTPLQYINFNTESKNFSVFNFHGTPFPGNKLDTKRRLLETERVKQIVDAENDSKILIGDFNLLPHTECIKIVENNMKNLIKEFQIELTRSSLSPFYGKPEFQKYADYAFTSKDIQIKNFQVPHLEISDHLPMILEFS